MATPGSDLSTRMSAEEQVIYNTVKETAGKLFKKYKVDISGAIKTTFPFLELLRDRGFITNEMYAASQVCCKTRRSIEEILYDLLSELEETFDLPLLDALFSKVIMEKYPDLKHIYRIFRNEIPNISCFLENGPEENQERSGIHLSIEQGDCNQIKADSHLLGGKEKGRRSLRPE
ncbi:nuclear body protein SP140-like protein [Pteronotus mesoamericanus]|uniref:nuclear body protein SP140-like protein n=1 Tax=Pteronotus mesoamericanus TaxID=1884717 RepID=UPI0023ED62BF|nr:nuclear body protein SP140-like protein [Pteronotus parnellii mesoamericanus]